MRCTCRHGSSKDEVGGTAAQLLSFMVAAVDIDAVQSERPEVGNDSSLLVIHPALKERVFCLEFFRVCDVIGVCHCGVPASARHGGVGHLHDISPLPFGSARKRRSASKCISFLFFSMARMEVTEKENPNLEINKTL